MNANVQRARARLDRLPAAWVIVVAGFLVQVGIAVALAAVSYATGNRVGTVVAVFVLWVVLVAGVVALPSALLFRTGRYPRFAATLAALVGVGTLVVNGADPIIWPFPLALFVAAVRGWAGSGLDAATLLRLDPERFERIDPPASDRDEDDLSGDPAADDST